MADCVREMTFEEELIRFNGFCEDMYNNKDSIGVDDMKALGILNYSNRIIKKAESEIKMLNGEINRLKLELNRALNIESEYNWMHVGCFDSLNDDGCM